MFCYFFLRNIHSLPVSFTEVKVHVIFLMNIKHKGAFLLQMQLIFCFLFFSYCICKKVPAFCCCLFQLNVRTVHKCSCLSERGYLWNVIFFFTYNEKTNLSILFILSVYRCKKKFFTLIQTILYKFNICNVYVVTLKPN